MRRGVIFGAAVAAAMATAAVAAERPIVVELFTSEGCSSCPPADAILTGMARGRADVLPLAFHVTYWDYLGWRDPFSLEEATRRQRLHAAGRGDRSVYTPNVVVEGGRSVVGSDRGEVEGAIARARAAIETAAPVSLRRTGAGLRVEIGAGQGRAEILVVGFDPERTTAVARGENAGRTLVESNVVRSVRSLGTWSGAAIGLDAGAVAGEDAAVILQAPGGRVVGAARLAEGRS